MAPIRRSGPSIHTLLQGSVPRQGSIAQRGELRDVERTPGAFDTFSRLSPLIDPRFSYRGADLVAKLQRACRTIGCPKTIRVDNVLEAHSQCPLTICERPKTPAAC